MDDTREQIARSDADHLTPVGLWELVLYFFRLGSLGFGGPIALAGYMQRDLIPRRWISEEEYKEGLAFAQMMPGPLAAQLAMWIGFIRHGTVGASLVGIVFILPAFLIVLLVSALYVAFHGLSAVQALFYGIGPAAPPYATRPRTCARSSAPSAQGTPSTLDTCTARYKAGRRSAVPSSPA